MFVVFWCLCAACDEYINILPESIMRINRTLNNGQTICIRGNEYFYIVLNKFEYCEITGDYLSKVRDEYSIYTVKFDYQSYTQPYVDFGEYAGILTIRALRDDAVFQAHAINRKKPCLDQVYITTKQTNSVQFSSKWTGNSELKKGQRLCLFLCPFGEFDNIRMVYQTSHESNYVEVTLFNETTQLPATSSDAEYQGIDEPAYAVWESGDAVDSCFLRASYATSIDSSLWKGYDGFYPVFNETLQDTLSREAIILISVATALVVIIVAGVIVCLIVWKKRRLERRSQTDSSSEEPSMEMPEERAEVPHSLVIVTDPLSAPAIEYVRVPRTEEKRQEVPEPSVEAEQTTEAHEEDVASESDSFESVEVEVLDISSAFLTQKRSRA